MWKKDWNEHQINNRSTAAQVTPIAIADSKIVCPQQATQRNTRVRSWRTRLALAVHHKRASIAN